MKLPSLSIQTLAVKLTAVGERVLVSGHPWLYDQSIESINKDGLPGDLAIIFNRKTNKLLGIGLYDPTSEIIIKVLSVRKKLNLNLDWFKEKFSAARQLREKLLSTGTNGIRYCFGENDGLPGIIIDGYDQVYVLKIYTPAWIPHLIAISEAMIETYNPATLVLRLSRRTSSYCVENKIDLSDGQILYGRLENPEVPFLEYGLTFTAQVLEGHKTGYFLDHRYNRNAIASLAKGKHVLDVFSYAGGFTVHALATGARSVTSIDISKHAMLSCEKHIALNDCKGIHIPIIEDAFQALHRLNKEGKKYDIVVIDPPSFAKRKSEISRAKHSYVKLARLGASLTQINGILLLASCSSRISMEEFKELHQSSLGIDDGVFAIVDETTHDVDHPIAFPEGAYLKSVYYKRLR